MPTVGLRDKEIELLAQRNDVLKASRRDLAVAALRKRTAATTVAATVYLAARAGIRVFATGGIGGVHRAEAGESWDVSADLYCLANDRVAVVCAGAKSILDLRRTLEVLETQSVPVIGVGAESTASMPGSNSNAGTAFFFRNAITPRNTAINTTPAVNTYIRIDGPPPESVAPCGTKGDGSGRSTSSPAHTASLYRFGPSGDTMRICRSSSVRN